MSAQSHRSDPRTLGRRTLERDHRRLAELLRPGMRVLDIGCGTGAITAGIAKAVGASGLVVGVDRDENLLELARAEYASVPQLRFEVADAVALPFEGEFDIVTSARTLQWIAGPLRVVEQMKRAARAGGLVVVVDYNHVSNAWTPAPPPEFMRFYEAFLAWRSAHGWDNEMADHLGGLFGEAGLRDVESSVQDEIVRRGDVDFATRSGLWCEVIEGLGSTIVGEQAHVTQAVYAAWVETELMAQTLSMRAVVGRAL